MVVVVLFTDGFKSFRIGAGRLCRDVLGKIPFKTPRRKEGEHPGLSGERIAEGVDGAPGDEQAVSGTCIDDFAVNNEAHVSFQYIKRLVTALMEVKGRPLQPGREFVFQKRVGCTRLFPGDFDSDAQTGDIVAFPFSCGIIHGL
jgi:hypothetical protein